MPVRLGALAWILAAQFYVAQVVVASAWPTPFNLKTQVISDLGNTNDSPRHAAMNASFIMVGITMAAGALLTRRAFGAGWQRGTAVVLFVAAGVGVVLVGVYPENTNNAYHSIGAGVNFIGGNTALILFGLAAGSTLSRPWFTWFSVAAGLAGLAATVLFVLEQHLGLGAGGMERVAAYSTTTWQIVAGLLLLRPMADRVLVLVLVGSFALAGCSCGGASPANSTLVLSVPFPPQPVSADGRAHLVYELHLSNGLDTSITLSRLDVLEQEGGSVVLSVEGDAWQPLLGRFQTVPDPRVMASGSRAVVFLSVPLQPDVDVPKALSHQLILANGDSHPGGDSPVVAAPPMVVGPPLRSGIWIAGGGLGNPNAGHRRALMTIRGRESIAQRYAIDWVRADATGRELAGDSQDNRSHLAYGAEVLAVADGVVSSINDGVPENTPGPTRAVRMTTANLGGNYVMHDLGNGRYAFYAHLQPGTIQVKAGDRVKRGQVLGRVGNSGNSVRPHLHFHVVDNRQPLAGEGVPYVIDAFDVQRQADAAWEARKDQIPADQSRVRFPD